MADRARKWTDKKLNSMEKRISGIYKQAQGEITEKWNKYMAEGENRLKSLRDAFTNASPEDRAKAKEAYEHAVRNYTLNNARYKELVDETTLRLANVNQIALSYVNDQIPDIYAKNYAQIGEDLKNISIDFKGKNGSSIRQIVNEDTVKRMIEDGDVTTPFMRTKKYLNIPKDQRWNTKKINSQVLQGILQGESMDKIADRLLPIVNSNESASIRNARTLVTGAENRGRLDSYERLEEEGVVQKKVWIATGDDRTREAHLVMDGQEVDLDEPFIDGDGNRLDCPADPSAPAETVYNCRCSMKTRIVGFRRADGTIVEVNYKDDHEETAHERSIREEKEKRGIETQKESTPEPEQKSETLERLENSDIMYREVQPLSAPISESEIIEKLGGGDLTSGSCSSLSFAYAGNKGGYDVTDFRGGDSMKYFSRTRNIVDIANLPNVEGVVIKHQNDFKATEMLIKDIPKNKEYILAVGQHSSIIRRTETGYEYLELQSATDNGYHKLTMSVLKDRFGCKKSHSTYGMKYEKSNILIDVEKINQNPEFKNILGYLNTATDKQKKGLAGYVR